MKCAGESEWTLSDLGGSGAEPLEENDPRRIGGIPLAGRLGAGGMGRVYLGVHEGRYVAVKQVLPSIVGEDKDFLRRFGHELDNLARLPEEATARLIASDRTARPPWLATAYVPGLTLREALELHGGPLPADALWLLLREAAEGLASVHALDMVHRDLKPSNVMLTVDGATLIDFGVARAAEQSQLTRTGMVVGTPAYMAPEQAAAARQLSGATDVFALGSVMAYAASGTPPFGDESGHAVLYRIVHEEPDLAAVRAVDPELAEIVEACLDKDGEARPTAAELLRRATERGPFTAPLWPEIISRQLSAKAEFAANVQEIDVPSPGPGATHPAGRPAPEPQEGGAGAEVRAKPRERRRRTRIVFAVVPAIVVLGGTTLAVRLLPYTFDAPEDQARATPSVSATGPAAPGPVTTGGSPSGTAAPGKSPGKEKAEGTEGDESGAKGKEDGEGSAAGGTAAGAEDGAGGADGSEGSAASGGSDSSDDSGGSGGSGGSTGSGTSGTSGTASGGTGTTSPSGTHRYRNGDNNNCLITVYGSADDGECSASSATWTVRSASGGNFELFNKANGQCLSANMLNQAVFTGACDQSSPRLWRAGSGGSLVSVSNGGCLDLAYGGGVSASTCAGEASQRWTAL